MEHIDHTEDMAVTAEMADAGSVALLGWYFSVERLKKSDQYTLQEAATKVFMAMWKARVHSTKQP